jgi:hypothetical protein
MREVPMLKRFCNTVGGCTARVVPVMSAIAFRLSILHQVHDLRTIFELLRSMVSKLEWNVTRPDPVPAITAKRTPIFHLLRDAGSATWRFQVFDYDTADLC